MQWTRVKSILLCVLLAVDLFLAINFGWKYFASYARVQQNEQNIIDLLGTRNISVSEMFALPESTQLPALEIERTQDSEDVFSLGLLGEAAVRTELGDGQVEYSSDNGVILWDLQGAVQANVTPTNYSQPTSATEVRTAARATLESAGISADFIWSAQTDTSITASFETAGVTVFNRSLTIRFLPDQVEISGWWTFDTPYTTYSDNQVDMTPSDAIFTFIDLQEMEQLESIQAGFLLTEGTVPRLQLVPAWEIVADGKIFYLDAYKKTLIGD